MNQSLTFQCSLPLPRRSFTGAFFGLLLLPLVALGAATAELATLAGIRAVNVAMKRSAADLAELAELVERGDVKPRMAQVYRLDEAREAQDASQQGRAKGKILLRVA